MGRGWGLLARRAVAAEEDVAGADALAELQLAVAADVGAAGVGEVLERARDERLGRPGGSPWGELDGRPALAHDLADVLAEAEPGHVEAGGGADLEHAHRQAEVLRRQHRVAQVLLVGVLDEVGVGGEREVADAELDEGLEPEAGVLGRGRPEAVADHAPLEAALAGVLRRREHHRVRQSRLAALEVDGADAARRRLVDDAR